MLAFFTPDIGLSLACFTFVAQTKNNTNEFTKISFQLC